MTKKTTKTTKAVAVRMTLSERQERGKPKKDVFWAASTMHVERDFQNARVFSRRADAHAAIAQLLRSGFNGQDIKLVPVTVTVTIDN